MLLTLFVSHSYQPTLSHPALKSLDSCLSFHLRPSLDSPPKKRLFQRNRFWFIRALCTRPNMYIYCLARCFRALFNIHHKYLICVRLVFATSAFHTLSMEIHADNILYSLDWLHALFIRNALIRCVRRNSVTLGFFPMEGGTVEEIEKADRGRKSLRRFSSNHSSWHVFYAWPWIRAIAIAIKPTWMCDITNIE